MKKGNLKNVTFMVLFLVATLISLISNVGYPAGILVEIMKFGFRVNLINQHALINPIAKLCSRAVF